MATPLQIAANQSNAQHSTGPKTTAGKSNSSRNRLSYGFNSTTLLMLGEDPQELSDLLAALTAEYQPATITEQILLEKMLQNQWLSLRAIRLQSRAFYASKGEIPNDLALLIRYQTTADRAFHKAHAELVKVQKERKDSQIGFEPQTLPVEPVETAPPEAETGAEAEPLTEAPRSESAYVDTLYDQIDWNAVREHLGTLQRTA